MQDESSWGTHATLPGHEGDVMVVKFLESERESSFFVSGDNAGAVRVWKEDNGAVSLALYICRAWLMLWTS
jgi:hypothetical protein